MKGKRIKKNAKLMMLMIVVIIFVIIASSASAQIRQPPPPKTVRGYVFLFDGVTGASAGTSVNVSVINTSYATYANISDSNETTTNDEYPYPNYYQCTVNGVSGDNVTVLAWNDTYENYGKNDTEKLNGEGFVTVNVTMNIPKGGDEDGDDLENFEEDYTYRTDRSKEDTDDGGENDGSEVAAGRDPLDPSDDQPPVPPAPPAPSPVAVPEYNAIGLLALIGILTIILAFATSRRKKE